MIIKDFGFRNPVIKMEDHIFGSAETGAVINQSGQWDEWLPQYEPQFEKFETLGCTVWGTENAIECLHKHNFGSEPNYSERFTYILAGINFAGGDPGRIAEVIRKKGLINQYLLSMTDTPEEFVQPEPMDPLYLKYGEEWLMNYSFGHQWVLTGGETKEQRIGMIKEALQYSVLGVAVTAWNENNGIYFDNGLRNNHWCVCFGWDDSKQAWKIFDSYDQSIKLYSYDSVISVAKRYSLSKRTTMYVQKYWFQELAYELSGFFKDMAFAFLRVFGYNK